MIPTLKEELEELGFRVRLRHRKLRHKRKTYMTVRGVGDHGIFYTCVLFFIKQVYLDAYVTSGGFAGGQFNMVVALEN